jgi:hypothetical protein
MKALLNGNLIWHSFTSLVIVILLMGFNTVRADTGIKSGSFLTIQSGTTFFEYGNASVTNGGTINNQGTIIIKGNLVNNSANSNLGTGMFEFAGSSGQTISGTNEFGSVRIKNTSTGVTIVSGNQKVNTALNLKTGLLILGANNLLLGPAATDSGGSSTSMVVATGTGELQKEFTSSTGSFTYPVGDADAPAEYSPVTANFTGGTFPSGNYLGVRLKNSPDPDPLIATGDFLNRYWELNNHNIGGSISCGLTFTFLPADVNGNPANIYCLKTSPVLETYNKYSGSGNQLTGIVSGFGRFTGARAALQATFTAFLQGPYSSVNHNMNSTLASTLPLGDRSDPTKFPDHQPYNGSPWNYSGSEYVTNLPSDVVDWLLIELRQASTSGNATASTIITKRAAFLKKDGSIVDMDGVSPVKFYNAPVTQNLYPVIRHRNHMAIMATGSGASKNSIGTYIYDYTTGSGQIYGGSDGAIQVDASPERWGMMSGDGNADNKIYLDDINVHWVPNSGLTLVYSLGDFNMDNSVYLNDINTYWVPSSGKTNFLP